MAGWTNRGKYNVLGATYRAVALPVAFYMALFTVANVPDADTNVVGDLTEITAGNGYVTGGSSLTPGVVDFDVFVEDDVNDRAYVQCVDITWTAVGGPIPSAGADARYAALTDDAGVIANREIWQYFDLAAGYAVTVGQDLTLQDAEIRINEV